MATLRILGHSLRRKGHLHSMEGCNPRSTATDAGKSPSPECPASDARKSPVEKRSVSYEKAKPFKEIPSLKNLPVIGTQWIFFPIIGKFSPERLHDANLYKHRLLGDIFRDGYMGKNIVTITNPDDVKKLTDVSDQYPKRDVLKFLGVYRKSRPVWYEKTGGLIVTDGPDWWEIRQQLNRLLIPQLYNRDEIQIVARDFVWRIHDLRDSRGEVPDLMYEIYKWALESVGVVALDKRLGCLARDLKPDSEAMNLIRNVQMMSECMIKLEISMGLWKYFPTPTYKKFERVSDAFSRTAFKHIEDTYQESKKPRKEGEDKKLTTLQALLQNKDLSLRGVLVTLADMIMAGIDTTSSTVAFFLYNLARFPEQQEVLFQTIMEKFPTRKDMYTNPYNKLFMLAFLEESMRMIPTVGGVVRVLQKDTVLSGYQVPKDTQVVVNNHVMSMDERLYKNAKMFLPERWMEKDFQPYHITHFGDGKRSCIGRSLAEMEILILIMEIVREFKLEYRYEPIGFVTRIQNVPDRPLRLTFIKRRLHYPGRLYGKDASIYPPEEDE